MTFEDLGPELDSDSGVAVVFKKTVDEPCENACFSNGGVANEDEFEEVVVVVHVKTLFFPNRLALLIMS